MHDTALALVFLTVACKAPPKAMKSWTCLRRSSFRDAPLCHCCIPQSSKRRLSKGREAFAARVDRHHGVTHPYATD